MRSPAPSFRSELAAIPQDDLLAWPEIEKLTLDRDRKRQLVAKIISTWMDRADAETIWSTVSTKLPNVTVAEFVCQVVWRRLMAEKLAEMIRMAPGLETKARHQIKGYLARRNYSQLGSVNTPLDDFTKQRGQLLGRQKSAPRSRFMWEWATVFRQRCGQPLDEVVRALTEIGFGGDVTLDAVRLAHRHWSTRPPKSPSS